jgi:superfamily II DNA or RNA helicase
MTTHVTVEGVREADVADAVGLTNHARGRRYARGGAVMFSEWNEAALQLRGVVRGGQGRVYSTIVSFDTDGHGGLELVMGECSCPIGAMCTHVAAIALAAVVPGSGPEASPPPAPTWESELDALLAPPGDAGDSATSGLAVELTPDDGRIRARLMRRGSRGWVNGGLSWNHMLQPRAEREHRADHVAVLRELYLLHHAAHSDTAFSPYRYYGYGAEEKTIDLAAISSTRLWPLLDAAADAGLPLLPARHQLGPLERPRLAELTLDVTAGPDDEASLTVRPILRFADTGPDPGARPVAFLGGDTAHGVLHVAASEGLAPASSRLRLARLDPPAPRSVWRAALAGTSVTVPADQVDLFRQRFAPRLAQRRTVTSSDGTFTPPEIGPPVLVLRAAFGADHTLDLSWEWSYDVGGTEARAPLASSPGEPFRDAAAEADVLRTVDDLPVAWKRFGLRGSRGPVPARLTGLDTAAFATEVLPVLEAADAVRVERAGEAAAYREVGDALRIGVSATESAAGTDWFDLGITVTVEGQEIPFAVLFEALARDEPHLLLPDGAYFSLEKPELAALRALIEEARSLQDGPSGQLRLTRYQAGWWEELAALGIVDAQARSWQEQVGGLLSRASAATGNDTAGALDPAPVPATLQAELRPYQREGFEWLAFLWRHRLGGVLADDMGLGKTVQALALICHAHAVEPDAGPVLIVAPTSVVPNWTAEAARFAPDLRVVALTDTLRRRGEDLGTVIAGADVVVTSYTLFRLDADAHEQIGWAGVLFDEAQFMKNRQSKVYQCARRVPAPFKLAITGTPMENDLMELWSLLSVTAPGLFPSPQRFRETYARPIERGGDAELLGRLRRRVRPLMLRRTKEQVSPELPPKQQQVLSIELTPAHRRLYERHLQRERQKILKLLDDVDGNRFSILASITRLRQLSLHPALVDEEESAGGSAKIDLLVEQLLDVTASGHRALVFSQFTRFLGHVRAALDAAGIAYAYLDGSTPDRQAAVTEFTGGEAPVFLISLKAGGFGLNLTQADYCFLLDPWWNPATEAQAIDRTHRIGQQNTVMVYRLIARDTIEEKVRALAERKQALVDGVMDDGAAFAGALDADDIRALVS